ncbi:MAG: hypothetical protein KIT53_12480 [Hydrogenophaga sp.]|nr:hypothetical protein [Hydrogenophaga sp.]
MFDTTAEGQQIKCLTFIDEYTRECLAIDVAGGERDCSIEASNCILPCQMMGSSTTLVSDPLFALSHPVLSDRITFDGWGDGVMRSRWRCPIARTSLRPGNGARRHAATNCPGTCLLA